MSEVERCHWDREQGLWLTASDEPCDQPRNTHCTARRSCGIHLGWGERTCARCLGRVRTNIRAIVDRAPLLMTAALENGRLDSEVLSMAGPAADVEAWSWRKVAAMQGVSWHQSQVEDDDDWHPYTVLTRWAHMVSEDYDHDRPEQWTIANAAAYLERHLHTVAQDEDQDFSLLAREIKTCRDRVDSELRVKTFVQRGVECPDCKPEATAKKQPAPRLYRIYAHWCDDPQCAKIHVATDELDIWQCPRVKEHWWSHEDYDKRLEERKAS